MIRNLLNFTVGPVQSTDEVKELGNLNVPYFRTDEFSSLMKENESLILNFAKAPSDSRAVFMTCSSSGSMEAVIINCFNRNDKLLIVNGGTFGQRFVDMCKIHKIPYHEIKLDYGRKLTKEKLYEFDGQNFTGLLVNVDETSTGVLYDIEMLGEFCKRNNLFFVCDCVSAFLAEPFDMEKCGADVMITGSQKALACPPGISVIVLSPKAINRVNNNNCESMYFNLQSALKDGERGQTPFTPAVSILIQMNARLVSIKENGGVEAEIRRISLLAEDFRRKIKELPLKIASESLPNGVTSIHPLNVNAYNVFLLLKNEYDIWICPNGGELKSLIFRVGHLGALTYNDNDILIEAFKDLMKRGLL